jgi:drug/metabolite transporter (DMT)-like permease
VWGAGAILLGLLLLTASLVALRKSARKGVGRPILFAVAGAVLAMLMLIVRGPNDWKAIPLGEDVVGVAIVIGIIIYVLSHRAARVGAA